MPLLDVRRIALLAPMDLELAPLVAQLGLVEHDGVHRAAVGPHDVLALATGIGMAKGAETARRALELGAEHVLVVGIAGGVGPTVAIGDLLQPAVVVDRATGSEHHPVALHDAEPRGVLSCGDDLIVDPDALAALAGTGVIALDMETAAVAAVCEEAGVPWSVFRAISDDAGGGLVDAAVFAMTGPDGHADPDALARYLADDPRRREVLARLAHDAQHAADVAARAAVAALTGR